MSPFFVYVLSTTNKQFPPNSFPIRYLINGFLIVAKRAVIMKWTIVILSCLIGFLAHSQEINIGKVENKIVLGDLAGNRDLAFGVRNVLEEVVQDAGYDLNPNSISEITVEILFFDVQKNNIQLAVYGKQIDVYMIAAKATLYKNGKKKKSVTAKGTAKSISTSTLVIDGGGKFSQTNVSTAIKKLCERLINKLKIK